MFLSVAIMLSATFVGCTKTDDDNSETNYATKLEGTFKGDAIYGDVATAVVTKSTIKATGMNVAEITVLDYQFNATTKSDLVISGVKVKSEDKKNLSLTGSATATVGGQSVDVELTGSAIAGGESVKYDISVSGSYNSVKYTGNRYINAEGAELTNPVVSGICVLSSEFNVADGVVTYTVPTHTREKDIEAIEATFNISDGATWAMVGEDVKSSEIHKLNPKKTETVIEVTAENGDKKTYSFIRETVTVEDMSVALVNTYSGDLDVIVAGSASPTAEDQKVSVVRTASNTVKLTLTDFTFMGMNIGTIIIDNVALYKGENGVNVVGDSKVTINLAGENLEVDVNVNGSYSLTEETLSLSIFIEVDPSLTVTATYTGTVFTDPTDTKPLFVSASHANILSQNFNEKTGELVVYVNSTSQDADYANLTVEIKLPEGATYKPSSGDNFDFTKKTQWYAVTAANGTTKKSYKVSRVPLDFMNDKVFSFTDWKLETQETPGASYSNPVGWQTPNYAVLMIKAFSGGAMYPMDGPYPVNPIEAGKVGKAAKMTTLDTKGGLLMGQIKTPKITAATIYTGSFNFEAAMKNALEATEFGLHYSGAKPLQLKGWYTYTPGTTYYDYDGTNWTVANIEDQASVSVILYDVTDNVKATITGVDTYTSPRIVAQGMINPEKTTSFSEFTVDLVYTKDYTPKTKIYKLAYIMSASKDGDKFKGAPGSTFIVDEVTLVTE